MLPLENAPASMEEKDMATFTVLEARGGGRPEPDAAASVAVSARVKIALGSA
jgi:hypothetical protein